MSEKDSEKGNMNGDNIASLVQLAGPRENMPDSLRSKFEQHFVSELALIHKKNKFRQIKTYTALAASLFLSVVITMYYFKDPATEFVATVVRAHGDVTLLFSENGSPVDQVMIEVGQNITARGKLKTGKEGRVLFHLMDGSTMVRLNKNTEVEIISEKELLLVSGSLYVDTSDKPGEASAHVTVRTRFADIQDIGTQFMVSHNSSGTEVAVREGKVRVQTDNDDQMAIASKNSAELFNIGKSHNIIRKDIATHGPRWEWVQNISPEFDTNGRRLIDIFEWVSRETGKTLKFDSLKTRELANKKYLTGSVQGFTPEETLALILTTSDFKQIGSDAGFITITHDDKS